MTVYLKAITTFKSHYFEVTEEERANSPRSSRSTDATLRFINNWEQYLIFPDYKCQGLGEKDLDLTTCTVDYEAMPPALETLRFLLLPHPNNDCLLRGKGQVYCNLR